MKSKLLIVLFMVVASFFARAEREYKKSSTECRLGDQKVSFIIASSERFTASEDDSFGEILEVRQGSEVQKLNISAGSSGRYRFFEAQNEICNNPLSMKLEDDEFVIFLGRDNRPFPDSLVIVHYNPTTRVLGLTPTKIQARSAVAIGKKVYFKLSSGNTSDQFGTTRIGDKKFNYIDKTLEPWIAFDGKVFHLDRTFTFERFEHHRLLQKSDLDSLSEYKDMKYKYATTPGNPEECLSLNDGPWRCR